MIMCHQICNVSHQISWGFCCALFCGRHVISSWSIRVIWVRYQFLVDTSDMFNYTVQVCVIDKAATLNWFQYHWNYMGKITAPRHNKTQQTASHVYDYLMMTSTNENLFGVSGPLWGESTGHRWIPLTTASDAELRCFLSCAPEQKIEQSVQMPVIRDVMALIDVILIEKHCRLTYASSG